MNIRDLEYLVALAEHRHFRRAADSCHVSQPTLSGQIRKLEDELGVMLLERTSRKVLFTQAGLLLVDQARTVLREVKVLKEMASQQGETMSGPLHIGLIPTIGPYLLPLIIPMLHQTFPKLEMYLHEAQTHQLLAQLDSGKLDCAILALVKESEAFIEVPLFDEPMMLAIYEDHPWANRDRVPMSDLAGEKLLMLEDGHCLRDQAMGFCFEAERMKIPISGRPVWKRCATWWRRAVVLHYSPRWPYRRSVSATAWFICHALSRSRVVPWGWFIARDRRCVAVMSNWQRPSVAQWMAISTRR